MQKTFQISISGRVQGVGFRPYVYGLAHQYQVTGTVSNNENGVLIKATGSPRNIENFYRELTTNPPSVSRVENHQIIEIDALDFKGFKIIPSTCKDRLHLRLTPDFAICESCKKEISNPKNRRFNYPFTTCVNCGPRWSITKKFPFDRDHTSLTHFLMCENCEIEYTNPLDRRFHSQTNSCGDCGITLQLCNNKGAIITSEASVIFQKAAQLIQEGAIIAIKNTSGYLLCCHAEKATVIQRLRNRKQRPAKPFAVMYPSLKKLQSELSLTTIQVQAFTSPQRPIIILPMKSYQGKIAIQEVAPGLEHLGVMLPYTGILQLLGNSINFPIVATSGNLHGSPIISDTDEAFQSLENVADYFLLHDLNIEHPQDDSVLKFTDIHQIAILHRRSRGYAPNVFISSKKRFTILAMGSDLKSTFTFSQSDNLYTSQYLGNLENMAVYERLTTEIDSFIDLFQSMPETILIDKHPQYYSSLYGKEFSRKENIKLLEIQHHKAHFASVLGEQNLFAKSEKILGVIWDGTGYGDDQQIWGGEFFEYHLGAMKRVGHFDYFNWLAGDKMSKEPRISLFSLCDDLSLLSEKFSEEELNVYQKLKEKNTLSTSSVGRLFDAVSSLLGICDYNTYEGEAAILLENMVQEYEFSKCSSYCSAIHENGIHSKEILSEIIEDVKRGVPKEKIATNFVFTLAAVIFKFAKYHGYQSICCSGGVFQNTLLVDMVLNLSKEQNCRVYFNRELSPNDENISFGQTMYFLNCCTL